MRSGSSSNLVYKALPRLLLMPKLLMLTLVPLMAGLVLLTVTANEEDGGGRGRGGRGLISMYETSCCGGEDASAAASMQPQHTRRRSWAFIISLCGGVRRMKESAVNCCWGMGQRRVFREAPRVFAAKRRGLGEQLTTERRATQHAWQLSSVPVSLPDAFSSIHFVS